MRKPFSKVDGIKKAALLLFAAGVIFPGAAHSEIRQGSFELSPFIGYNFFESQQNLQNRLVYGGRLGYNFTPHFALEGVGEFTRTRVDDRSQAFTREGQFTSPIDTVKITRYHLDLLYHFQPDKKVNPFFAVGYGFANYSPRINSRDMAIFNFGIGVKYWLAENVALRVDLRDHLIYDEKIHDLQAAIGLVFAFGGKSSRPAPVVAAAYEPKPEPKPVVVAKVEKPLVAKAVEPEVIVLALEDIHFDFDQSTLNPKARTILKRNIQLMKDNPKAQIRVAGYTSAAGTEEYNQKLSERRAAAVKEFMISEGVAADRLATIGYGQTTPARFEATPKDISSDAAKANMRVLFEIVVE